MLNPDNIILQRLIEFEGPGLDLMAAITTIRTGLNNLVSKKNLEDKLNSAISMG